MRRPPLPKQLISLPLEVDRVVSCGYLYVFRKRNERAELRFLAPIPFRLSLVNGILL